MTSPIDSLAAPRSERRLAMTLRGQLGLALLHLSAGAAWLTADDAARVAAAMITAPILVDLVFKLWAPPRLAVWTAERRTQARAPFLETLQLANWGALPLRGVQIREPRTFTLRQGGAELPILEAGREVGVRLAARSPQRGVRRQRRFELTTAWPLGFFRWHVQVEVASRLVTEPARVGVDPALLAMPAEAPAAMQLGRRDDATEFHSLREYRYGEDARLVHARRSAALGQLVRMQFRGAPEPDGAIIVDLRTPPGRSSSNAVLEAQLGRAATVCDQFLAAGTRFRAVLIDGGVQAWMVDGRSAAQAFLERLATARTVPHRPLDADEVEALSDGGRCVWFAAGGHLEPGVSQRDDVLFLTGAAS